MINDTFVSCLPSIIALFLIAFSYTSERALRRLVDDDSTIKEWIKAVVLYEQGIQGQKKSNPDRPNLTAVFVRQHIEEFALDWFARQTYVNVAFTSLTVPFALFGFSHRWVYALVTILGIAAFVIWRWVNKQPLTSLIARLSSTQRVRLTVANLIDAMLAIANVALIITVIVSASRKK